MRWKESGRFMNRIANSTTNHSFVLSRPELLNPWSRFLYCQLVCLLPVGIFNLAYFKMEATSYWRVSDMPGS